MVISSMHDRIFGLSTLKFIQVPKETVQYQATKRQQVNCFSTGTWIFMGYISGGSYAIRTGTYFLSVTSYPTYPRPRQFQ